MTPADVEQVCEYTDVFQIGARNSQNYYLLEEVGKAGKPVMLKRGMSMLIEEWLLAAEYMLSQGNPDVILCERGIRTYETATRNTLDIAAVPVVQRHVATCRSSSIRATPPASGPYVGGAGAGGRRRRGGRSDDRSPPESGPRRSRTACNRSTSPSSRS